MYKRGENRGAAGTEFETPNASRGRGIHLLPSRLGLWGPLKATQGFSTF